MYSYSHHSVLMSFSREQEKSIFSFLLQYPMRIIFIHVKQLNETDTFLKINMLEHILYRKEYVSLTYL